MQRKSYLDVWVHLYECGSHLSSGDIAVAARVEHGKDGIGHLQCGLLLSGIPRHALSTIWAKGERADVTIVTPTFRGHWQPFCGHK